MRSLRMFAPAVVLAATLALWPSSAVADPPLAVSGGATSITSTSAVLNGAVSLGALLPTAWSFQWGSTGSYGNSTPVNWLAPLGGLFAVGTTITGLRPGTVYHFRLLVAQSGSTPLFAAGGDLTFKTLSIAPKPRRKSGRGAAGANRLAVHSGVVTVPIACTGSRGASCSGFVLLSVQHNVVCGGANVALPTRSVRSLKWAIGGTCLSRLLRARKHRVSGTLSGAFASQRPFRTPVTVSLS